LHAQNSKMRILGASKKPVVLAASDPVKAFLWTVGFFLYYIIGVGYYSNVEGWSISDCIYFITVSISTVGYGHFVPTTDDSRVFTVFYIVPGIVGIFSLAKAISRNVLVHLQSRALDGVYGRGAWRPRARLGFSVVCVTVVFFIGLLSYAVLESWTGAKSFYWTVITMTTVGYGDLSITSAATRRFGVFFILLCMLVFALAVDNFESAGGATHEDEMSLVRDHSRASSGSGSGAKDSIPPSAEAGTEAALAFCVRKGLITAADADAAREYARRQQQPTQAAQPSSGFDEAVVDVKQSASRV